MIFFTKEALSGKLSRMSDRQLHQLILETDNYDMRIEAIRRSANAMALADVIVRKPDLFGFVYPRLKELADEQAMADLALRCPRLPSVGRSVEYVKEIVHYLVHDPKLTERIALESCNPRARYFAAQKVTDQEVLAELALRSDDSQVRCEAVKRLEDDELLKKITLSGREAAERIAAVRKVKDEAFLAELALGNAGPVCADAVLNPALKDQALIIRIYCESGIDRVRKAAAAKITDEKILDEIDAYKGFYDKLMYAGDPELINAVKSNTAIMKRIACDPDRDRGTRATAALALYRRAPKLAAAPLAELLKNGSTRDDWCPDAARALMALYKELDQKDEDPEIRALIATVPNGTYGPDDSRRDDYVFFDIP